MSGTIHTLLYDMWLSIWGNSLIAAIALVILFAVLCFKRNLSVTEGSVVLLPVIFGIVLDNTLPQWVTGVFLISIGTLWALFILRIAGNRT